MQDGVCDEDRQLRRLRLQPPVAERMHNLFQLLTVLLKVAKLDLTAPVREHIANEGTAPKLLGPRLVF